jgi:cytosine/adenosine deaminase-related metal-dependent hydrolase
MSTLLIKNARCIATFDDANPVQARELKNASLFIRDHRIAALGPAAELPQNAELFGWLRGLYPIWAGLTPDMVQVSTQMAMAELLMSGCTTSSDHLYIYPNGVRLDDSIHAATEIGMRFVASRGSMSVGQSQGGLPPDWVVEQEAAILKDTQRLIETWHDATHGAMVNVAVAPCSPNCTPTQYAQDLGWLGADVWHAHCVKLDDEGIRLFAATRTGVAHCPCSNMRLASGIAPIRRMLNAGVPVGLGVDGSASNDAAHLVNEARQAMLLARVGRALLAVSTLSGFRRLQCTTPWAHCGCARVPKPPTPWSMAVWWCARGN